MMRAPTRIHSAIGRPQPIIEPVRAFLLTDGRSYALGEAPSLEDALRDHLPRCSHKQHFAVQTATAIKIYAVKRKSTPRYVHVDHETRRMHDLYAEHVCDVPVLSAVLAERNLFAVQS